MPSSYASGVGLHVHQRAADLGHSRLQSWSRVVSDIQIEAAEAAIREFCSSQVRVTRDAGFPFFLLLVNS